MHHNCADRVRAALAEAGLERYDASIAAHLDNLRALPQREQSGYLKSDCGVSVLGHRHQIVALLAKLSSADATIITDVSDAMPTTVAASSSASSGSLPPHMAAMVHRCEKMTVPLPFHQVVERREGERLPLSEGYPGLWRVHDTPPVYLCDSFLTHTECDALMRLADPLLRQSLTDSGKSRVRTSKSTHLRKQLYPCPEMLAKVHALTKKPVAHMELPQVARYEEVRSSRSLLCQHCRCYCSCSLAPSFAGTRRRYRRANSTRRTLTRPRPKARRARAQAASSSSQAASACALCSST